MKSPRHLARWIGLGLLAFLMFAVFLVISAPATMLARVVAYVGGGAVTLQKASGSIWRGDALLSAPRLDPVPLGTLRWSIKLLPLFTGKLGAELQLTGSEYEGRGSVRAGFGHYALRDLTVVMPARMMASVYVPARLFGPSGRLRLTSPALELDADGVRGAAKLVWEEAGSGLPQLAQVGDYLAELDGKGERADIRISTLKGILLINGQGDWQTLGDGTLRLHGSVRPSPPQPALDAMLQNFAPKQPDGGYAFSIETRLPLRAILPN